MARGDRVEVDDLSEEIRKEFSPFAPIGGPARPLGAIEKEYILATLELNGSNQTRTAEQLQIGGATLYRKLKSYGLINGRGTRGEPNSNPSPPE